MKFYTKNMREAYEIYGPQGVALLVEVTTDNRNRTASDIRSIATKNGGTIATQGSVSRLFHRKGQIIIPREAANEDQVMEVALDAGAEDFKAEAQGYEILTEPGQFEAVHKQLEAKGIKPSPEADRRTLLRLGGLGALGLAVAACSSTTSRTS